MKTTCPECRKSFGSWSGIVAHLESISHKCPVRHSDHYGNTLYVISGGFFTYEGKNTDDSNKIGVGIDPRTVRKQEVMRVVEIGGRGKVKASLVAEHMRKGMW